MDRSLRAVLAGTFTLRFSTGLTGVMLTYYLADFQNHGGGAIDAFELAVIAAFFYASELVFSPFFGILSDRFGHHRLMQVGPFFGIAAAVITWATTNLLVIGGTRILEGGATAASVPSILGFIAAATAADELLRGRAVARFEAATLSGLLLGFVVGGLLWEALGPTAFLANAVIYGVSLSIYRFGVDPALDSSRPTAKNLPVSRYVEILRGSHVWLLAPTWIAINAVLGLYTTQTIFQLVNEPNAKFADQALMGGFDSVQISAGLAAGGLLFFAGLIYWGGRFKALRRTTIILYGIGGGGGVILAGIGLNHSATLPTVVSLAFAIVAAGGLFVLAGATPAAIGLLADITEAYPEDRGAIMGLYSVFLGLGQILGNLLGGAAADVRGLDGIFGASFVLLAIALVPLSRLRRYEHYVAGPSSPAVLGDNG
ncbi:MAG TPA: MFS transporter [Candidatus Limnocylindrales bacterium]